MSTSPTGNVQYRFTFLRHGESVGNAAGYYQGQSDYELNDTGKAQARALAKRWKQEEVCFDAIITSPLLRAAQTAEIIAQTLGGKPSADPIWMERDNGKLSGLTSEEAQRELPRPKFIHPYSPVGVTGESQWELYLRAGQAVQNLVTGPEGNYLIVSHGGLLNAVLYAILGIAPQANFQGVRFRFRNAAFATLTYRPGAHIWLVEGLNDHAHWPDVE